MGRIYNGEEHVALQTEKTRLEQELETVSVRMNEEYESDSWDDPEKSHGKMMRYNADNLQHARLSRELEGVTRQIDRMEDIRPMSASERRDPMRDMTRRWFAGGSAELDEGERQIFIREIDDETSRILRRLSGGGLGEVFDPWAIATDGGTVPLPERRARMAAGDPGRSDISTESASGAGDAMGAAAPETWATGLVESLAYFGSVASSCHNFNTSNGNDFHQNQMDTADEEGGKITDQTQTATGTPGDPVALANVGDVIFKSSWRHSKFIDVRIETLDDIHFDVAGRVMRDITRRLGRGWNREFTQGVLNGAQGIVASAKEVAGGTGSIISSGKGVDYQNLLDMEYAIDLAYLQGDEGGAGGFTDAHGGMIGWMMNRLVEKNLRFATLVGAHGASPSGLPIWVPDPTNVGVATQRPPARILGFPYTINQHMDDGAQNDEKPLLFGSCGHYGVRNIGGPMMYRFWDSAMASRMAVRFIGFSRRDGRCRGPGTVANGVASACEAYAALKVQA